MTAPERCRRAAPAAASPLRPLRLFALFFRIGALNELQYRANLAVQLFQSVDRARSPGWPSSPSSSARRRNLGGWTQSELLAVMGVHILMGGVIRTAIQPNMERLMTDVRQGTLDFILTKPEDAQVMISVREFRIWQAVDIVVGASCSAIAIGQLETAIGLGPALVFAGALLLGARDDLLLLADPDDRGVLDRPDGRAPRAVRGHLPVGPLAGDDLPGLAADRLTFLVPIAFAVTVPAEALTSRLTLETLALAAAFAVGLCSWSRAGSGGSGCGTTRGRRPERRSSVRRLARCSSSWSAATVIRPATSSTPNVSCVPVRAQPSGPRASSDRQRRGADAGVRRRGRLEVGARRAQPLARLDPRPVRMVLGLELAEPDVPDLLLDRDQVADDLGRRPLAGRRRLLRRARGAAAASAAGRRRRAGRGRAARRRRPPSSTASAAGRCRIATAA